MDGFGVHTFALTKKGEDGKTKQTYVKFHWHTDQGVKNLTDDEAVRRCAVMHCMGCMPSQLSFTCLRWSLWLCIDKSRGCRLHLCRCSWSFASECLAVGT